MKDSIITLENGINYYILDDLDIDGRKFIIGSLVNIAEQSVDEDNCLVKEVIEDGDGYEVISIEDQKLAEEVTLRLLEKIRNTPDEGVEA